MKKSAGIVAFNRNADTLKVLLVHPGGPFFKNKDLGSWSIPKGLFDESEDPLLAAQREFLEETGFTLQGAFIQLNPITQKSGKVVYAWAIEQDIDLAGFHSNTFELEWPPKSKKMQHFPEVDKAEWFTIDEAILKILPAQEGLLKELVLKLK